MTKIAFTIFHQPNSERHELYDIARTEMLSHFSELDTPSIFFKDDSEMLEFYKNNELSFDGTGIDGVGWRLGQLGLWAGTYLAVKNFLKSDYDSLIILEDDIVLKNGFVKNLLSYMNELPKDWALFFGFVPDHFKEAYSNNLLCYTEDPEDYTKYDIGQPHIIKAFQEECTVCYVISRDGAQRIIDLLQKPFKTPIDFWLFNETNLPIYTISPNIPNICYMATTDSQIRRYEKRVYKL